jgi:tetratricopeptide (TPR) repeat protein
MSSVPSVTDVPRTSLAVAESALARADGGDLDGAVAELRAHLAAAEDDDEAWLALAMVLSRAERWEEAREAAGRAVDLDGDVLLGRVLYARALERTGKLDDAVFQLLRASKLDEKNAGVLRELGSLFYKKALHDKALPWLLRAKTAAHGDAGEEARAAYAIGLVQEARRDPGAAIAAFREAIALDPKHLDARKTLADALAGIGEHAQAISVLDELLRVDRTNEQAATNREVLERALVEMRERRLLGKGVKELEKSALVQAGQLKRRGRTLFGLGPAPEPGKPFEAKYTNALSELYVSFAADGTLAEAFLVLGDPAKASSKRDTAFQVTVVAKDGRREPASYATAVTLTFLREVMGVPMTQAGELYALLLGGKSSIEFGGLEARFHSREVAGAKAPLNGLLVTATQLPSSPGVSTGSVSDR